MPARCMGGEPASGVPCSEDRPFDGALHQHPSGRRSAARGDEGRGGGAPAVRLSQGSTSCWTVKGIVMNRRSCGAIYRGGEAAVLRRRGGAPQAERWAPSAQAHARVRIVPTPDGASTFVS